MLHKRQTVMHQLKRIDHVGMCLFMLGLILLLLGLNWGGSSYPWNSARVIATIVVGFLTVIAFVFYGELDESHPPGIFHVTKSIPLDNYVHKGDALLPIYL